jgi:hypothetical protein
VAKLQSQVSFDEPFSYGVVKARTYKRGVPAWAFNDKKVRALILRAFPKMASSPTHKAGAGRWGAVIHLYFRMGYTRSQIAEELGSSTQKVHGVIRSILRVSKGLRADGSGRLKANMP